MKKRTKYGLLAALVIAAAAIVYASVAGKRQSTQYDFASVTTGNIVSTVSSTGTLSPVDTVEVGTQVSGTILKLYADYNTRVKQGQILAVLDTIPLKTAVLAAAASLATSKAQLAQAQSDYDRNLPLYKKDYLSESSFLPIQTNLAVQKAAVNSAQATLTRAQQNLDYAIITSPIDGTVLQRNVEEGQTVAASFATPTLFIIARNLSRMEIQAQVDESDIGQIRAGESATFQVPAYPDSTFGGVVQQIYLQPTVVQNVVNYTVIVIVENASEVLLPGMTATIDFIVEKRDSVLRVPNAALYFQPTAQMVSEIESEMKQKPKEFSDSTRQYLKDLIRNPQAPGGPQLPKNIGSVWYLNKQGKLDVAFFQTGITDGLNSEVLGPTPLHEGMEVIVGLRAPGSDGQGGQNQRRGFRMF